MGGHRQLGMHLTDGSSYFADLRMTYRQNVFLQDWFRNKLGVGLGLGRVKVGV